MTEGRDQGTEVFPDADLKVFLTATADERAKRRVGELQRLKRPADFDTVLEQIVARDERDQNRAVSPLRPADDAHIIDTTDVSLDNVVHQLVSLITTSVPPLSDLQE